MTDYTKAIDQVESILADAGVRPDGIYCQITGKLIGVSLESSNFICDQVEAGYSPDSIADDLLVRILASSRPSLRWNKMRVETLDEMRKSAPLDVLAYLLNRTFALIEERKIAVDQRLGDLANRIQTHAWLTEQGMSESFDTILYLLLEMDAKWNLTTESAPFTWADFRDAESHAHRVELVAAWHTRRMADWQKLQKAQELQTRWTRSGNPLAKPAFFNVWMERKPPTPATEAKQEKLKEQAVMNNMLAAILGESNLITPEQVIVAKPTPFLIPSTKMPKRFGVKKVEG